VKGRILTWFSDVEAVRANATRVRYLRRCVRYTVNIDRRCLLVADRIEQESVMNRKPIRVLMPNWFRRSRIGGKGYCRALADAVWKWSTQEPGKRHR